MWHHKKIKNPARYQEATFEPSHHPQGLSPTWTQILWKAAQTERRHTNVKTNDASQKLHRLLMFLQKTEFWFHVGLKQLDGLILINHLFKNYQTV